ncbi:2-amino-4-hydroxy-6-hydroxymethyldihydropteridine diphosphokinase [Ferrimonas kyonanensis]|uniref:2-amino-4-hydroxy-6- hydroxymethyldihydropteridine diphosphokinase n=1 Tax=Ferrimonas kyonanensis TaxID=364763 RepID=UPI00040E9836|nr:2-amino-4-hydroxy-6-hydroxymethyldihydropteridine diphosphokinase [Ferrimonas kyonanensis]
MPNRCHIALGSNLGPSVDHLHAAIRAIDGLDHTQVIASSSLYTSPPMAGMKQPDYTNAVIAIDTALDALELLDALQEIERAQGRERHLRWGARTLDLDIISYGRHCLNLPRLTVPHYGVAERAFVLLPLFEIAPHYQFADGRQLTSLLAACPPQSLTQMPDSKPDFSGTSQA